MITKTDFENAINESDEMVDGPDGFDYEFSKSKAAESCYELAKKMAMEFANFKKDWESHTDEESESFTDSELFDKYLNQKL